MSAPGSGGLEERVLEALRRTGRPLTIDEVLEELGWEGKREPVRAALAELVRRGLVRRVPDYERRRMAFEAVA